MGNQAGRQEETESGLLLLCRDFPQHQLCLFVFVDLSVCLKAKDFHSLNAIDMRYVSCRSMSLRRQSPDK